ncbi:MULTISPECIES: helix-hairpin-helix domain-containing protein [Haloferacaceae]|uniref:Helix-hairpin-helix domain-containing protein n=1 Tax=Halorubrum glutamatedens TaxID=2707018 RepID=A0ABD5QTC2_9EURY|nr:helix-hairpin-helix domain-containing protein [Halobellus captivus]
MTEDLTSIDGVGPAIAEQLREAGFETVADVEGATVDELADVHMLGESSAEAILEGNDEPHGGRDSTFTDELARRAISAAEKGKSQAGIEREVGVGDRTIFGDDGWIDQEFTFVDEDGEQRQFSRALRRARGRGEDDWIHQGRDEDGDSSFAKFMLASSYDYKKTEKREVTGDGGGPVQVTFEEEVVETPWEPDEGGE